MLVLHGIHRCERCARHADPPRNVSCVGGSLSSRWTKPGARHVRIALTSPLYESVPPRCYGGTERVVWWLTEELVARGHDVTLFCSGDSQTSATQVALVEQSLRLHGGELLDPISFHLAAAHTVRQRA